MGGFQDVIKSMGPDKRRLTLVLRILCSCAIVEEEEEDDDDDDDVASLQAVGQALEQHPSDSRPSFSS